MDQNFGLVISLFQHQQLELLNCFTQVAVDKIVGLLLLAEKEECVGEGACNKHLVM